MRNTKQVRLAVIMLMLVTFIISQAQAALISERTELQLGHSAAKQVESTYKLSRDWQLNALVVSIGKRITAVSSRPNIPWQFKVVESKNANAFSVPGYVYINRGLIDLTRNDRDALAGVIAHEIAHTTARHAVERVEKLIRYRAALEETVLNGGDWQTTVQAMYLEMLSYSRQDELEADRLAVRYLHAAGYDPNGMLRFFNTMQKREGQKSNVPEYLRSHPTPANRLAYTANAITALGLRPSPVTNTPYSPAASQNRSISSVKS